MQNQNRMYAEPQQLWAKRLNRAAMGKIDTQPSFDFLNDNFDFDDGNVGLENERPIFHLDDDVNDDKKSALNKPKIHIFKKSTNVLFKKKKSDRKKRAILEIKRLQRTSSLLIPRRPFVRVIREITNETLSEMKISHESFRFTANAIEALHEASESYAIGVIEDANLCTIHANRVTLMEKDVKLATKIRGDGHQ